MLWKCCVILSRQSKLLSSTRSHASSNARIKSFSAKLWSWNVLNKSQLFSEYFFFFFWNLCCKHSNVIATKSKWKINSMQNSRKLASVSHTEMTKFLVNVTFSLAKKITVRKEDFGFFSISKETLPSLSFYLF